jgi:hypothetical protein
MSPRGQIQIKTAATLAVGGAKAEASGVQTAPRLDGGLTR